MGVFVSLLQAVGKHVPSLPPAGAQNTATHAANRLYRIFPMGSIIHPHLSNITVDVLFFFVFIFFSICTIFTKGRKEIKEGK